MLVSLGPGFYGLGALLMILVLRHRELPVLHPMMSVGYALPLLFGAAVMDERNSFMNVSGVAVIIIGLIFLISSGIKRNDLSLSYSRQPFRKSTDLAGNPCVGSKPFPVIREYKSFPISKISVYNDSIKSSGNVKNGNQETTKPFETKRSQKTCSQHRENC